MSPRYKEPVSATSEKYYTSNEELVRVVGGTLHILRERNKFKLTFYKENGGALKLKDLSPDAVIRAVKRKSIATEIGEFKVLDISLIERMLTIN